jgi:hypothetical protein
MLNLLTALPFEGMDEQLLAFAGKKAIRLTDDKNVIRAIRAIETFRRAMVKEAPLESVLCLLAIIAVTNRANRKLMEKFWSAGTGKSWDSLVTLPAKVRALAQELDQMNLSAHFNPQYWFDQSDKRQVIRSRLMLGLPNMLRLYSAGVERKLKLLPKIGGAKWSGKSKLYMPAVLHLSRFVDGVTGKPRDKHVADLLNAAAVALGEDVQIDALNIAQARSELKKSEN